MILKLTINLILDAEELPRSQDRLSCNQDDVIYSDHDDPTDPTFNPNSEDLDPQSSEAWSEESLPLSYVGI